MILRCIEYTSGKYTYSIGHYKPNGHWNTLVEFNDLTHACDFYSYLMGK